MRLAQAASWLHKWLALIIGVQVLFWVASGLFFAIYPIEEVRSEHRMAEHVAHRIDFASVRSPSELAALLPAPPARLTYEADALGRLVAVAEYGEEEPAFLLDAVEARILSPLDEETAAALARAHIVDPPGVREVRAVTEESAEYRGALPAWRVMFDDGLAVYVAAETGRVTARRSDLWRVYDALWALHIMDWRDHENFNTWWLIAASVASLIVVLAGVILIPYRLGWIRKPRAP